MSKEIVFEIVKNVILEVLPGVISEQISIEKSLKELGANSIDRLEIVTLSMEQLDLKLPLMSFSEVNNIGGLVDVLTENYINTKNSMRERKFAIHFSKK